MKSLSNSVNPNFKHYVKNGYSETAQTVFLPMKCGGEGIM